MDWSKAKTQMIYVFIILNIFLGYLLWQNTNAPVDDFDVKKELLTYGIKLDTKVPSPKELDKIRLEYHLFTKDEIIKLFFKDPLVVDKPDISVYTEGFKKVILINDKLLRYSNTPEERIDKINNIGDAEREAEKFLRLHNLEENMVIKNSSYKYDLFSIEFAQRDKESKALLESAFTIIQVGENGVVYMERQTFKEPKIQNGKLQLRDPRRKLMKLVNYQEAKDKKIVDIETAYIFDPGKNPYVNNAEKAAGGIPNLGLRVQLDDGYVILLN